VVDRSPDGVGSAGVGAPDASAGGATGPDHPDQPPVESTIATLRAAVLVLSRRMRYRQASDDISSAEAAVLGRLGPGPRTPGQLAKAEHVRPPSMTPTIERLETRGYVRREADPQDGRQTLVFRTPAGDEFAQRSRELRTAWLAAQFDQLDPADQQVLEQAAAALRRLSDLP
jgi:DNA-binding MarR family transcriptional regulator